MNETPPNTCIYPTVNADNAQEYAACMEAGEQLARAMRRRGWSVERLAEASGVSANSIRAYRSGEVRPRPASAMKVALAFTQDEAADLLAAWEFDEASEFVTEHYAEAVDAAYPPADSARFYDASVTSHAVTYEGRPLDEGEIAIVRGLIESLQERR